MSKTVFITGGSSGIGAETARRFAKGGYNVILSYNHGQSAASKVRGECRTLGAPEAHVVKLDLTNQVSINRAVREIQKFIKNGTLDIFVSNAGYLADGLFKDSSTDENFKMGLINYLGPIELTRQILKFKPAKMIFVGSDLSLKAKPKYGVYGSTKWGLRGFALSLMAEDLPVAFINPDPTNTPMIGNKGRNPKEVAEVIFQASRKGSKTFNSFEINVWEAVKTRKR